MRKGIVLQIVIILLILVGWNLVHLGYEYLKSDLHNKLDEKPLILISSKSSYLETLKSELDTLDFVNFSLLESDSLVSAKLIDKYDFTDIKYLVDSYTFPSILRIYFSSENYKTIQKEYLESKIFAEFGAIIINYDNNFWQATQNNLQLLDLIYLIINGIILFFSIFLTVFLRLHFEHKANDYWIALKKSGELSNNRGKQFWLNSLTLFFVPVILVATLYFSAIYLYHLEYEITYWIFGGEAIILFLSLLISWLFLREKF